ncbi:hypothetical protein ABIC15_001336 [Exiguobacterium sp. PvP048]|uniref:YD repeat protein n=1 Tax=Exiguobacterium sibiricum (strain DSM 17290 / CCUG 55495 / CIP 109462 / JCM 13490 / 255-15) TaxID=262543 RepID=B1YE84_EXIS2|nr:MULTISPECIES: hypothetical protein [Exiguobacterium]ACB60586.1 hypothetical protein Exig_1107 [Exiguobacterium sibiricum 255-15]MCT4792816.1 hypothetical protein [Exiguobacterium artemiae]
MLQPYVQLDESGRPQKGLLPETADGRVVEFYYDTNGADITVVFVTIPAQDASRKRAFTVGKTFKTISTLEDFTLVRYDLTDHKILATLEMFADGSKRQIDASRLLDY